MKGDEPWWESEQSSTLLELPGLEPDNLLAILALLGLLRALDGARPQWHARSSWDGAPLVGRLHLRGSVSEANVAEAATSGIETLVAKLDTDGRKNVDFDLDGFRRYARRVAADPVSARFAASISAEAPAKDGKLRTGPLVMLFGQGHQNFLERITGVGRSTEPLVLGKRSIDLRTPTWVSEALFARWKRDDATDAFRWDPEEDQRYALRFGNPSKSGAARTVHGANRLAILGMLSFFSVPRGFGQPASAGWSRRGQEFVWPIWLRPLSLAAVEALLVHPDLMGRRLERLNAYGVQDIFVARRIANGKFMNVTRAAPVAPRETDRQPSAHTQSPVGAPEVV